MEELKQEINHYKKIALRAVKIAIISCVITLIFAALSLWVLLNQITATANISHKQNAQEKIIQQLQKAQISQDKKVEH